MAVSGLSSWKSPVRVIYCLLVEFKHTKNELTTPGDSVMLWKKFGLILLLGWKVGSEKLYCSTYVHAIFHSAEYYIYYYDSAVNVQHYCNSTQGMCSSRTLVSMRVMYSSKFPSYIVWKIFEYTFVVYVLCVYLFRICTFCLHVQCEFLLSPCTGW